MQLKRLSNSQGHDKYLELCSLFCTGSLDRDETADFEAHLVGCQECQLLLADYAQIVTKALPLLADEGELLEVSGFDRELKAAKKNLFARLEKGSDDRGLPQAALRPPASAFPVFPAALAVALSICLGVAGYWLGANHRRDSIGAVSTTSETQIALRAQLENTTRERDRLEAKLQQDERLAQDLNKKIASQMDQISKLRGLIENAEKGNSEQQLAMSRLTDENSTLRSDREATGRLLRKSEHSLADLKDQVNHLESERVANLLESANLQKTVADLTARLASPDASALDTQRLLASDRDIRELMGARDLLIADVADVDGDGTTRKPFGRVFYTKNKSLIFYAFDLDRSRGFRNTKAFQAWGAKSSDDKSQPVSMGIFYLDNEANRRWVLKFDDPKVLEQIDSVFVTLEPKGGSDKPSRNQLLYAYLLTKPNHP